MESRAVITSLPLSRGVRSKHRDWVRDWQLTGRRCGECRRMKQAPTTTTRIPAPLDLLPPSEKGNVHNRFRSINALCVLCLEKKKHETLSHSRSSINS